MSDDHGHGAFLASLLAADQRRRMDAFLAPRLRDEDERPARTSSTPPTFGTADEQTSPAGGEDDTRRHEISAMFAARGRRNREDDE